MNVAVGDDVTHADNKIIPDTIPDNAVGSPKLHSTESEIFELKGLESTYVDTVLEIPLAPVFIWHFGAVAVMLVLFCLCWCQRHRVWVSDDECTTLRGEICKPKEEKDQDQ